jgi:hypothetical protein
VALIFFVPRKRRRLIRERVVGGNDLWIGLKHRIILYQEALTCITGRRKERRIQRSMMALVGDNNGNQL